MSVYAATRVALRPYVRTSSGTAAGRYLLAVTFTAVATLLRLGLTGVIGMGFPFAPFFLAILASAWFGGLGPGVASTLLSMVIVDAFWVEPVGSLFIGDLAELGGLLLCGAVGVGVSAFAEGLRRSGQRVADARHTAETYAARVALLQAVTAELSGAVNQSKIAEIVARHGRAALEADAAVVALAGPQDSFEIIHSSGIDEASLRVWRQSPTKIPTALLCAIRTARAWVLDSLDSDERRSGDDGTVLSVPMHYDGHSIGAIALRFLRRRVGVDEIKLLKNLASECSLALDRVRLFEAEKEARARAERAAENQKQLLAIVSHDLRNSLGVVMMAASAVLWHDAPPSIRRHVGMIRRAGNHMNALISDLLDAASVEAGAFHVVRADELAVGALVDESLELARPVAEERSITLVRDVTDDVRIVCHRERLLQVLNNLIGNALRFTPEGGTITVCARATPDAVEVSVADTGPGIVPDQLARIFERYARGPREAGRGSGLGLYIAKGIVQAHDGTISVESRPGRGATFRFTIPRRVPA